MLLNIENIYKYFNGEPLLRDISLTLEDREAVGLIGANGCGKTTLLNIITGSESFDKTVEGLGSVSISSKATIGYLRQNSGLDTQRTILEEMKDAFSELYEIKARMKELSAQMETASGDELDSISEEYAHLGAYFEARDGYRMDVRIKQVLSGMGFADTDTSQIVATLSGGEKTRLALAKLLLEEPNLLILDEPTNHLDFAALMWLEDHLKNYKGSLLIVSHDRYFINKVCTRICEISQGHIYSFKGDYSAYLLQKKMRDERQLKEYEAQQKEIAKLEDYIARNKVRASTAKMAKSRQHMLTEEDRIYWKQLLADSDYGDFCQRTAPAVRDTGRRIRTIGQDVEVAWSSGESEVLGPDFAKQLSIVEDGESFSARVKFIDYKLASMSEVIPLGKPAPVDLDGLFGAA